MLNTGLRTKTLTIKFKLSIIITNIKIIDTYTISTADIPSSIKPNRLVGYGTVVDNKCQVYT